MRKLAFCICKNKDTDQLHLIFASLIVQSLYYLNPKLQASSHLLWLYSPVCVGPGGKHRRPVFSERGLYCIGMFKSCHEVTQGSNQCKMGLVVRKTVLRVFDQVRHKPVCAVTEDGKKLKISDLESRGIVVSV